MYASVATRFWFACYPASPIEVLCALFRRSGFACLYDSDISVLFPHHVNRHKVGNQYPNVGQDVPFSRRDHHGDRRSWDKTSATGIVIFNEVSAVERCFGEEDFDIFFGVTQDARTNEQHLRFWDFIRVLLRFDCERSEYDQQGEGECLDSIHLCILLGCKWVYHPRNGYHPVGSPSRTSGTDRIAAS